MSERQEDTSGLIMYLSRQSLLIRIISFVAFVVLIIVAIVGITTGLYYANVSNLPRQTPIAITENLTTEEYITFEDDEAYPAALATTDDGILYTGSYLHGAIWRVNTTGDVAEIPQTRDQIGSVIGLDTSPDGTLYILDNVDVEVAGGAVIWAYDGDALSQVAQIPALGTNSIGAPNDIAVTDSGEIFVLDIQFARISRLIDGEFVEWWQAPNTDYQPAGLAYNPLDDTILISDALRNAIYAISVTATDTEAEIQTLYQAVTETPPFFNGLTVAPDGLIYVAALGVNEVWEINLTTNGITKLAGNYRGSSDVAYNNVTGDIYVNNWDQRWLEPIVFFIFPFDIAPRLPFSVDVISPSESN